ncbi:MAG: zinc-dependent alcohol dehydrogenase family protein [Candidatus Marinimicrobia bacterium]|nr:zinc-dependent alcohol dehydrogenase family protein [Candidatus Neomarinimicrobiota bacterium]
MRAMILDGVYDLKQTKSPLKFKDVPMPSISDQELLIKVKACGVCHTEIDEIEGRTPPPAYPVIPGHEVVGIVEDLDENVTKYRKGDRVGVAWIYSSCGECKHCLAGNENLCPDFKATGRDENGGYAEYMKIHQDYAHSIPDYFSHSEAAPFLCAGAIGYRSLMLTEIKNGMRLGLTGFGASGHLVLHLSKYLFPDTEIYVFARSKQQRKFAQELGAKWAGDTEELSPEKLDSIIDTTPVWKPVVEAMKNLTSGARLVINAIRKEDLDKDYLLNLNYSRDLWMEKEIKSVANVSRSDPENFLQIAADMKKKPEITKYDLEDANKALIDLRAGDSRGAKVLTF